MIRYLIAFLIASALMYPTREAPREPANFDDRLTAGSSIDPKDFDRWNNSNYSQN